MKIAVYGPAKRLGMLVDGKIVDLRDSCALYLRSMEREPQPYLTAEALVGDNLGSFLSGEQRALATAKKVAEFMRVNSDTKEGLKGEKITFGPNEVKLWPPILASSRIMCYGRNFADHVAGSLSTPEKKITTEEARKRILDTPIWGFYKLASNFIGHEDPLEYPARTKRLDYEGEIAAIIGKKGKDIKSNDYLNYVIGFTILMDFSIRDSRLDEGGIMNFALSKNFDGSGSLGPWIVTKDEIPNPYDLNIVTKVNGEVRQNGTTRDMARGFGELMQLVSSDVTLNPGDVLASGTPAGTALDTTHPDSNGVRDPSRFLKVGDVTQVSSEKIGLLRNTIVAKGI